MFLIVLICMEIGTMQQSLKSLKDKITRKKQALYLEFMILLETELMRMTNHISAAIQLMNKK